MRHTDARYNIRQFVFVASIILSAITARRISYSARVLTRDTYEAMAEAPIIRQPESSIASDDPVLFKNESTMTTRAIAATRKTQISSRPQLTYSERTGTEPLKLNDTDDSIDWDDPIFRRMKAKWDNDPIVIESHKLMFFAIPKNACTTFKMLFRRMMGVKLWAEGDPHNPDTNGLRYLGSYPKEKQLEFMTSPNWTRAVFIRDPLERTLSAYMDKGLKTGPWSWKPRVEGAHVKKKCCLKIEKKVRNPACNSWPITPYETPLTRDNFPFEAFVSSFMRQCYDEHWEPQINRMRPRNWKWINFVGRFENARNDTRRLLEKIGAYEEFGASGWGEKTNDDENGTNNETLAVFEVNAATHKTGAKKQMKAQYAAAPETERLVMQYYRLDYSFELFNFTLPINYTKKLFGWRTAERKVPENSRRGGGQKAAISEEFRQRLT